jgi:histidinol-phosphate aminotransferase
MPDHDLDYHGDRDVREGLVDLAVNVMLPEPPEWLRHELAEELAGLAAYPDPTAATEAVAVRHGHAAREVLVTAGAAEAFGLLAGALRPRHAVVVHPQFTEPERALRAVGHAVRRVLLTPETGFVLTPGSIPDEADLVFVGNPTNPTSVLHSARTLLSLIRPGRLVVVDEAFMDAVVDEPESLAGESSEGLVVIRSLTKTWGIAGLRAGYLLAGAAVVRALRAVQPPWSVSALAARAVTSCSRPSALAEAAARAAVVERDRDHLVEGLRSFGVEVAGCPRGPFVLVRLPCADLVRARLRTEGYAVRRGDTFPGLDANWLRITVREPAVVDPFLATLAGLLS